MLDERLLGFAGLLENAATGPTAVARSSTSMDVFYRTTGGQLAEDYWSAAGGWGNQTLAGGVRALKLS